MEEKSVLEADSVGMAESRPVEVSKIPPDRPKTLPDMMLVSDVNIQGH